ncbi:MAG: DUF4384 domain-containing protein [Leptolyngbyaceae bacterium]|nr:DUF4384 domain-containing protein [Leptolyngbyaceae bacterium]
MSLTRRTLLQRTSLALTSFGLGQMGLSLLTHRYQQVLATPTSRKLALLIGINSYPDNVFGTAPQRGSNLDGAVTDVTLVKELLIARFGFNPADILILQDKQATRSAIETAFQTHLLEQVGQDDVVVFHCSGLGSYVRFALDQLATLDYVVGHEVQPTFVPVDGRVARGETAISNDLLLSTMALFLGALPTRNIVSILDFGYSAPMPVLGNFRVRSRLSIPKGILADQVFEQHRQLGQRQPLGSAPFQTSAITSHAVDPSATGVWPGLLITAADGHGVATEAPFGGFTAGLLTYTLTQRLWWATPALTLQKELGQVVGGIERYVGNHYRPAFTGSEATSGPAPRRLNLLALSDTSGNADGVVSYVDAGQQNIELWLGGLPALVLQHCLSSSYFKFVAKSGAGSNPGIGVPLSTWGQVRSHNGLRAKVKPFRPANALPFDANANAVTPGMLVHEAVRLIPQDMALVMALGNELERIERVDATSALSSISIIKSTGTGEQQADCVFDKIRTSDISILPFPAASTSEDIPNFSGVPSLEKGVTLSQLYGLFQPGRSLIPGTMSPIEEAVKTAVRRVTPQFSSLLAEKLLRLTVNQGSSRLGSRVTLETVAPFARQVGQQYTSRSPWEVPAFLPITPQQEDADRPTLFVGDQIQCRLQNYGDRPLYGILFNIDSRGLVTVLHPLNTDNLDDTSALDAAIQAKTITTVPTATTSFPWTVSNALGIATVYVIMSCAPFTTTITELSKLVPSVDTMHRPQTLASPLPIARSLLADLHHASQPHLAELGLDLPSDRYCLSVDCWATFRFTYNVSTNVSLDANATS